jgi:hypothetical protein
LWWKCPKWKLYSHSCSLVKKNLRIAIFPSISVTSLTVWKDSTSVECLYLLELMIYVKKMKDLVI